MIAKEPSTTSLGQAEVYFDSQDLARHSERIREPVHIVRNSRQELGIAYGDIPAVRGLDRLATLPSLYPEWLGDRAFVAAHGLRFPYVAGEMAGGIATTKMVVTIGRLGMMGFFGAGGLAAPQIQRAIRDIRDTLQPTGHVWGANLIHDPRNPRSEAQITDLYIKERVERVSASAFMSVNANLVRLACHGLRRDTQGRIVRQHWLFPKISRPEMAQQIFSPAPAALLDELVKKRQLTPDEAQLGRQIPLAEDVTVEADSGGHTDNRPLGALFPVILSLRDEALHRYGHGISIRVGAAGGLGSPAAVAAAFSMGAAYVMTGSVNQSAKEAGMSEVAKRLLAEATIADITMAPSADMFELGVRVQVLQRGTWFPQRAQLLYDTYKTYRSLSELPLALKRKLEEEIFQAPLEDIWNETLQYLSEHNPADIDRARHDSQFQMALVFRWYLAHASRWAIRGEPDRQMDYQLWCGPAMGAFNNWVRGSFLEALETRTVDQIALNLMEGAAVLTRVNQLRIWGVPLATGFRFAPRLLIVKWDA